MCQVLENRQEFILRNLREIRIELHTLQKRLEKLDLEQIWPEINRIKAGLK